MALAHEIQLHPTDYPFGVQWSSAFGFSGVAHIHDTSRVVVLLTSPCCGERLLQKSAPPHCLTCNKDWSRFTDLDPAWREYYYPARLHRSGDELLESSLLQWFQCSLEVLTDHFTGVLLAEAMVERLHRLRQAMVEEFGSWENWQAHCRKRAGGATSGFELKAAVEEAWAERVEAHRKLLQAYSGDLLLEDTPPVLGGGPTFDTP